jgi:hypothetical protein
MEDGVAVSSGVPVSHEAIYQAIYAVPRGELLACLCQSKPQRGRRTARPDLRHHPRTAGGGGGMPGAGTLGGRSDHGDRQLLLGRHAGRAHQPQAGQAGGRQSRDSTRWLRRRLAGGAGTAAPHPDRRPGQGDGPPSGAGRAHGPTGLLRRPACAVAARLQREHQRPAAPVLGPWAPTCRCSRKPNSTQSRPGSTAGRAGRSASRPPTRCSPRWWTRPPTPSRHQCGGCSLGNLNPPRETLFNL